MSRLLATILVGVGIGVVPQPVDAQRELGFRLGLDGLVVSSSTESAVLMGAPATTETVSNTTFGLPAPRVGLSAAFVVEEAISIGMRLGVASVSLESEVEVGSMTSPAGDVSTTEVTFTPFAELRFIPESSISPALSASVGVESVSTDLGGVEVSRVTPIVGGAFTLHMFAADSFSISPYLFVDYAFGTVDVGMGMDADYDRLRFGVGLGLHGWLWGDDEPRPSASSETQPSYEPQPPSTPAAPAEPTLDADGRLTTSLALPNGSLELAGRPMQGGNGVTLTIRATSAQPTFSGCGTLIIATSQGNVVLSTSRGELSFSTTPIAGGVDEHAIGRTDIDIVQYLAGEGASVSACETQWPLDAQARAAIQQFVVVFRSQQPAAPAPAPPVQPAGGQEDVGEEVEGEQ